MNNFPDRLQRLKSEYINGDYYYAYGKGHILPFENFPILWNSMPVHMRKKVLNEFLAWDDWDDIENIDCTFVRNSYNTGIMEFEHTNVNLEYMLTMWNMLPTKTRKNIILSHKGCFIDRRDVIWS